MVDDTPAYSRRGALAVRAAVLAACIPAVWFLAHHDVLPHVSMCIFQIVTHRPCPGCGMTRSILNLGRGDVLESLRLHPLGVPLAAMLLAALAGTIVGIVKRTDPVVRFLDRAGVRLVVVLIAAFVVTWVLRAFMVPSWAPEAPGERVHAGPR